MGSLAQCFGMANLRLLAATRARRDHSHGPVCILWRSTFAEEGGLGAGTHRHRHPPFGLWPANVVWHHGLVALIVVR